MSRIVSFVILIAIILVISVLFFRVMSGFWLPLFLAALLVVIFKPVHDWMVVKTRGRMRLAAILTTLTIMIVVLAPLAWAVAAAVSEAANLYKQPRDGQIEQKVEQLRSKFGLDLPFGGLLGKIDTQLTHLKPEPVDPENPWDEYDWPKYDWSAAQKRITRLHALVEELGRKVRAEYDPDDPEIDGSERERRKEQARRQEITAELEQVTKSVDSLTQLFVVPPAHATAVADAELVEGNDPADSVAIEADPDASTSVADVTGETEPVDEPQPAATDNAMATHDGDSPALPLAMADNEAYLESLNQAEFSYRTFRQVMLGGHVKAWMIELVNPNEAELRDWSLKATGYIQHWLLSLTGQATGLLGSLVFGLCIMVISIYYFLIDGPTLIKAGMRLSPLDDQYELELLAEFDKISRAVVLATLLSAIVQGILSAVGYFFVGVDSLFLLFVLTTLLAMVPFVGAAAVWVPVCLWVAFVEQRVPAAIGLGLWGAVVVSMADNIIKPWVLHGQSNLHPLLALLSVLGGVQALGPIGILVGPMVVSFLQASLNIFQTEIVRLEGQGGNATNVA